MSDDSGLYVPPTITDDHIYRSMKRLDRNAWLVGDFILVRSSGRSAGATWNDDEDKSSYSLVKAPHPLPSATAILPDDAHGHVKQIHAAGNASAVWAIGGAAFCKVKLLIEGTTPEVTTLRWLREKKPKFAIPEVLQYFEHNGRSYLFLTRLPGRTLMQAWPSMDQKWRQHYVRSVAEICKWLSTWQGDKLSGVDGQGMPEYYFMGTADIEDFSPAYLESACRSMGMDCSRFVFYHADLGPGNIMVEEEPLSGAVGILDWETAGFFPRGWIRTKFRVCGGMDFDTTSGDDPPTEWRAQVGQSLRSSGFEDDAEKWVAWRQLGW